MQYCLLDLIRLVQNKSGMLSISILSTKETTTTKPSSTSTSNSAYYPKCNKSYTTLTKALDSVHIDSSKEARAKIAKANGIKNYQFTAEQNNQMLILLKAGKLKKFK